MGTSALLQVPKCWNLKPCCSLAKKNLIHTFYISQGSSSSVSWEGLLVVTNLESSPGTQQSPLSSELQRMSVFQLIILVLEPSTFIVPVLSQQPCFLKQQAALFSKKTHKKTVISAQETAGWQKYLQICCRFVFPQKLLNKSEIYKVPFVGRPETWLQMNATLSLVCRVCIR